MKCESCKKEINQYEAIRQSDTHEGTTIHMFCSEKCKKKWISMNDKIYAV